MGEGEEADEQRGREKMGVRSKSEGGKQISEKGEQMSKWEETE